MKKKLLTALIAFACISIDSLMAQVDNSTPSGTNSTPAGTNGGTQNTERTHTPAHKDMSNHDITDKEMIPPQGDSAGNMHHSTMPMHNKNANDTSSMHHRSRMGDEHGKEHNGTRQVSPDRPVHHTGQPLDTTTTKKKKDMYLVPDSTRRKNKVD